MNRINTSKYELIGVMISFWYLCSCFFSKYKVGNDNGYDDDEETEPEILSYARCGAWSFHQHWLHWANVKVGKGGISIMLRSCWYYVDQHWANVEMAQSQHFYRVDIMLRSCWDHVDQYQHRLHSANVKEAQSQHFHHVDIMLTSAGAGCTGQR